MSNSLPGWSTVMQAAALLVCASLLGLVINHQVVRDAFSGRLTLSVESVGTSTGTLTNFPVPVLMRFVSQVMTLFPGDIITTGTPSGIGPMLPGDRIDVQIEGIGTLSNTVMKIRKD